MAQTRFFSAPRHLSEQVRTASQSLAHFLRHMKGNPHAAQIFVGRSAFLRILGIGGLAGIIKQKTGRS
jgi:hypothetical protein